MSLFFKGVSSGLICHGCRSMIARSPASIQPPTRKTLSRASLTLPSKWPHLRTFTTSRTRCEDKTSLEDNAALEREIDFSVFEESAAKTTPSEPAAPATSPSPPIPWYLQPQHNPSRTPLQTERAAREEIPDLPPNPPPLLQTLLEYISITAGLDDLLILDLRHLDPPPALGPKLIMIIGTARSEKHLHVSADRFCRHLRREYGLRANAAGLLGRNELKIKLRRKMKRMKMLANVGGREPEGNIDDGIRTGWICCTVGKVEAHPEDTDMPGVEVDNFVGFRDVKPGVNIVVQMFTEEKRAETDLETLWGGVLKTHARKDVEAEERLKALAEDHEDFAESKPLENSAKETENVVQPSTRPVTSRIPSDTFPMNDAPRPQSTRPSIPRGRDFSPASARNSARQSRSLHDGK